jgi:hypothetical protein
VDLFNNSGQKIKTVFAGNLSRGKHNIGLTDKINNIPSGVYMIKIQAGDKSLPLKLVIK